MQLAKLVAIAGTDRITAVFGPVRQDLVRLRGTLRLNAGGTIIPQFQFSAAPGGAPTILCNSFFRCWPISEDTRPAWGAWV